MGRVGVIVCLVVAFTATAVAGASPTSRVRLPVTVSPGSDGNAPESDSVVVEPGDHLWKISARRLGDGAEDGEIAPYWRVVVDVNTTHLRSGDPDLIFPGEVVELPAIP